MKKQNIKSFIFCYMVLFFIWQPLQAENYVLEPKNKIGQLLTLPDILQTNEPLPNINKTKETKPFLTIPFHILSPNNFSISNSYINKNKQKTIWKHNLPERKPIKKSPALLKKTFKDTLAISTPSLFRQNKFISKTKTIKYPNKHPKKKPISIKVAKAPVGAVMAKDLAIPNIPKIYVEPETKSFPNTMNKYILFEENNTEISQLMEEPLQEIKNYLNKNQAIRLQLRAFAIGENGNPSSARRISLSRALSVRAYLKQSGIRVTRMDIRALGDKTKNQPINRVDFIFIE